MAIKFKHLTSEQILVAESEPHIAALFNSSDRHPNALGGQDLGWRLAPEVVVEMNRIKADDMKIMEIANRFRKPFDEIKDTDVLMYISMQTKVKDAPVAKPGDYDDSKYRAEIAAIEAEAKKNQVEIEEEDDSELEEEVVTHVPPKSKR